ncbi:hypothetical protein FPOA_07086 [Fusarium poae]|uniref:Uncharacterized protein n=1 Tax=Fusarium poae TaxID=36050 RepID=A0A1B8AKD7_FUSPO|nr:hypothetical protein FPOA_07086 [Fusarium poae]
MSTRPHTSDAPDTGQPLLFAPLSANGPEGCTGLPKATSTPTVSQPQPQREVIIIEDSQCLGDQQLSPSIETAEHQMSLGQTPCDRVGSDVTHQPANQEPGIKQEDGQEPSLFFSPHLNHAFWEGTSLGNHSGMTMGEDGFESDTESAMSDNDDSDYVDDEASDSDTNDLSTSRSKKRDEASRNIEARLKDLENKKGNIVYLSEHMSLSEKLEKELETLEGEITKSKAAQAALNAPKIHKPKRRRPVKNVREYFARKHEDEDKRAAEDATKKRKGSAKGGVQKKRKTSTINEKGGAQKMSRIFDSMNGIESVIAENNAPVMPKGNATTQKELFSHYKKSIPEGSDVRRNSTQQRDLKEAWKMFGPKTITAAGDRCLMKGMQFGLLDYQLMAVGWMMSRECGRTLPYGGILADAPGLGKTVTSLAAIIGNPPDIDPDKTFCKATLIVVPNKDIADQWHQEVEKHCRPPYSDWVLKYRPGGGMTLAQLKEQLIIITTYHTITKELPKKPVIERLKGDHDADSESFKEALRKKTDGLFSIKFRRVILDEAHQIKNNDTRVKLACCMLSSKYHWALTGTPLSNKLEEIFPYLQFTGCKFTKSIQDFRKKYIGNDSNNDNLETLISMIMLRRTNQDTFLGHKVLPLPKAHAHDIKISLSVKETAIYNAIDEYYRRIIRALEAKLKKGGDQSLKQQIDRVRLARQVRLRQVTSHPFTIEKIIQERFREDDIVGVQRAHNKAKSIIPILESLKDGDKGSHGLMRFKAGMYHLETLKDDVFGGNFDMKALFDLTLSEANIRGIACGLCKKAKPPVKPVRSSECQHVFCQGCILKALASEKGGLHKTGVACPKDDCDSNLGYGETFDTLVEVQDRVKGDDSFKEPGRDINNARPLRKPNENGFFIASTQDEYPFPPSSKLTTAMAVCAQWLMESPDDKIVVFTQFIMTGKVMGRMLETFGVKFAYYYSSGFSDSQRTRSIKSFKTDPDCKVLIAGLGCGAQSLNLTVANRVLSIEPWWNRTRELQAFGRVHRMGQEKECTFVRIMTQKFIDSRIDELQQQKQEIIDRALQDDGHVPTPLSDVQLRQLIDPDSSPETLEQEIKQALEEAGELDEGDED